MDELSGQARQRRLDDISRRARALCVPQQDPELRDEVEELRDEVSRLRQGIAVAMDAAGIAEAPRRPAHLRLVKGEQEAS